MKTVIAVVAILVGLLGIAAGVAKIALIPDEVKFLSQFGFTSNLTIMFGVLQTLGGLLFVLPATRVYGSLITTLAFALSAILLSLAGDYAFAAVSLLPVVLAGLIGYQSFSTKSATAPTADDA